MSKKRIAIIASVFIVILFSIVVILLVTKEKVFTIKIKEIDEYSPDIQIIVLANNKEYTDYKYIKYNDNTNTILCYAKTPVINKFELEDANDLIIVLNNGEEKIAKIVQNDK